MQLFATKSFEFLEIVLINFIPYKYVEIAQKTIIFLLIWAERIKR